MPRLRPARLPAWAAAGRLPRSLAWIEGSPRLAARVEPDEGNETGEPSRTWADLVARNEAGGPVARTARTNPQRDRLQGAGVRRCPWNSMLFPPSTESNAWVAPG
jgi:hypothetical protein